MRILAVIAYVGLIFAVSSWQHPPGTTVHNADKLVHTIEYAGLGVLLFRAVAPRRAGPWQIALVIGLGLLVGVSDELYQRLTPGRQSSVSDLVADVVGLGLGAGLMWIRTPERDES